MVASFMASEKPIWPFVQIFDFFGGRGKDVNGICGSPIRILKVLNQNAERIKKSGVKIRVIINEFEKPKFDELYNNFMEVADEGLYEIVCLNNDFTLVFDTYYPSMRDSANFLFMDQNGIMQITEIVFSRLIDLKKTDFIFSSSYIKRFSELDEFKKYLNITKQEVKGKSYYHIHRIVLNYCRNLVPNDKKYFMAPFSIKKPTGIYGLIFGSNHTYGIEKFLSVCWKHDKLTGEVNFDIDNEGIKLGQPSLFQEFNIPSKRQVFESGLRNKILNRELIDNVSIYMFTLSEGFLLKDANTILRDLKKENKIKFDFTLLSDKLYNEKKYF